MSMRVKKCMCTKKIKLIKILQEKSNKSIKTASINEVTLLQVKPLKCKRPTTLQIKVSVIKYKNINYVFCT